MEHLLSSWSNVATQLIHVKHILLLTDYDGTLTPIVERPKLANLSENTIKLLRALARQHHFTVGIISSRALIDLKNKVSISNIIYAGNNGLEVEGPGISFVHPGAEALRPLFRLLHCWLSQELETIPGVLVEDKGLSISVHYRLVERHRVTEVEGILQRVVSRDQVSGKVKIESGKKVYEVRPEITWDKGEAVKLLMDRCGRERSELFPMYFGDDLADEDGFRAIEDSGGGLSVFVGEPDRNTAAHYFLKSPAEVNTFLGLLLEQSRKGFS